MSWWLAGRQAKVHNAAPMKPIYVDARGITPPMGCVETVRVAGAAREYSGALCRAHAYAGGAAEMPVRRGLPAGCAGAGERCGDGGVRIAMTAAQAAWEPAS